ncbi:MAG TPA: acyl carrier protein [Planctomycetota bacterium]|jgi:acyl carrier protein
MDKVEQRVKNVVARVLGIDIARIKSEHSFTFDLGAQSVQSIELVAAFEEEFNVELDEDAALNVSTVGDAVKFLADACKAQGIAA